MNTQQHKQMNVNFQSKQNKPKKSWALMSIESEEEEEQERKEEEQRRHKNLLNKRRELYLTGKYELEDGELIE